MAEPVRCDVCGGLFSSRHLNSHKRLAHPNQRAVTQTTESKLTEQDAMRRIVDLFGCLSEENKKNVLYRLTLPGGTS
jgi:hypothetical protein